MKPFYDSVYSSRLNTLMKAHTFTQYTDDTLILAVLDLFSWVLGQT